MVWMKLDEVRLDRRVEDGLAGRRHVTGLGFLHGDDVLALEGRKKERKLAAATAKTIVMAGGWM